MEGMPYLRSSLFAGCVNQRSLAGSGSERSGEYASAKISEIDKSREPRRGGRVWRDPRPPKIDALEFFV